MNPKKPIAKCSILPVIMVSTIILTLSAVGLTSSTVEAFSNNMDKITNRNASNNQLNNVSKTEKKINMTEHIQKPTETVAEWFNEKSWFKGSKIMPGNATNLDELKKHYALNKEYWERVFDFISKNDLKNLEIGKYTIDGENIFASVSEYETRLPANGKWEAHKKYLDIQIVLSGKELIGIAPVKESTVVVPYDETKDVMFVETSAGKDYQAQPGTFFIFFPTEAHRPNMMDGQQEKVKKIVFKVRCN